MTGPLPGGSYVFQTAQPVIQAQTPTTAIELFPSFTSHSDRMTFLAQNQLHLRRWLRSDDQDIAIAEVKLPPSNLHPLLVDRMLGNFRITLPSGLTQQSVLQWAISNGLRVINYLADSGVAIVRPLTWRPPIAPPVRVYAARRRPAAPAGQRGALADRKSIDRFSRRRSRHNSPAAIRRLEHPQGQACSR